MPLETARYGEQVVPPFASVGIRGNIWPVRRQIAVALAVFQAADLVVTHVSPKYGDEHLDHLGVSPWLRPVLPMIKIAAVVALLVGAKRRELRSVTGAALVPYYAAAATFHLLSGDRPAHVAPALMCANASPLSSRRDQRHSTYASEPERADRVMSRADQPLRGRMAA